ncbi:auxin response factor 1-like [Cynara cardunculus var. scolymus]|uniref:auxin response factor 1-like n=1 Tax=Cynara cardunculus var. scolymus TaxID=59895 RepID=UPI000D62713D|nr:auxin response factor 1-like [Cynara cardunculus var. scolymus]
MASFSSHNGINNELYKELWMACAGPLVDIPVQGQRLQLEDSVSHKLTGQQISELDLPHKMLCQVVDSSLKVDSDSDEVFAIIKLHPFQEMVFEGADDNHQLLQEAKPSFRAFSKILTISDTNMHTGLSVPKMLAQNCFPSLDLSQPQPNQELIAKDLHGHAWHFTHVYRVSTQRHVITGGWNAFVVSKRLVAGDALIFVRHSNNELGIGIRRYRQQIPSSSSILSRESMHQGVLASVSHALYTNKEFVIYYNPRYTGVIVEETDISEDWPGSTWRSIKLSNRMSRWQLEPIQDGRSDVSELDTGSLSSRHKRLRTCDHGLMNHRANANLGDSVNPLHFHAILSSSTDLIDKGKECENPQVLRLFGVNIELVFPNSSDRVILQMEGNVLVQTIDVRSLGGYEALKNELEKIFKIESELHHGGEKWEVVYEDGEGDLMLLGDKPWREFCKIVKKMMIRGSDHQVKKMIGLGFKLYLL